METESIIFDSANEEHVNTSGFYGFKLLRITTYASLYYALKQGKRFIIKTTKDNSQHQEAMLKREYELSIGCDHPHIVHIYTLEQNTAIGKGIVMEYIEGRTLSEYLAEKPSISERQRIANELLSAVGYLHKRGIIHNDLKPENILITYADNTLKIIDFGLADSDAEYALQRLGCTPHYASPELRARNTALDARSDIYSLGVILREILQYRNLYTTSRCQRSNPSRRYNNVESLQRALRWHRNRWKRALAIITIVMIGYLTSMYITSKSEYEKTQKLYIATKRDYETTRELYTTTKMEIENRSEERQRTLELIDHTVDSLCNVAIKRVKSERYMEFGSLHLLELFEKCTAFRDALLAKTDDLELQAIYTAYYDKSYINYCNEVNEECSKLPSLYTECDPSTWDHYNSLIQNRLPFKPYSESE